ncbi:MAG: nitrogen fixation protein NifHD [Methanobacteriales archaeon HGW-Methanobacteriales-1]|nr:MAG: nitrogen fixation protein NifHD [Methanobacteriales archaeon HGW-Methanobacteriales-1]
MKEIIAIIRPNKMAQTKEVLDSLGFPAMTANRVIGRGNQKAIINEVNFSVDTTGIDPADEKCLRYIPKRMITLVVLEDDVSLVVEAIMKVNCTEQIGDGKIFICPVEDAVRVRTKESGDAAIL